MIAIDIPIDADVLHLAFGILPSPIIGALAMSLSFVSVIANALPMRTPKLWRRVEAEEIF